MNENIEDRVSELRSLVADRPDIAVSDESILQVLKYEDELAENREILSILYKRGLLSDQEFRIKIRETFNLFLSKISGFLGEDLCRLVYNYIPNEHIEFLGAEDFNLANEQAKLVAANIDSVKDITDGFHTEIKVLGYLNSSEPGVMPFTATPLFQSGDKRYVCERSGTRDIDSAEIIGLDEGGLITWVDSFAVSSDKGCFLLHEDVTDLLHYNHPAALVASYLLPVEEHAKRTELANAYLTGVIRDLCKTGSGEAPEISDDGDNTLIQNAMNKLECIARALPEMLAVRVLKAAIADYSDNTPQVDTEMAQFGIELSRCGISRWEIDQDRNSDIGRGWHEFHISENRLVVIVTPDPRYPDRMGYESNAKTDPFSLRWFNDVVSLVDTLPWLAAYKNILKTISLFQFLLLYVREHEKLKTEKLKHYLVSMPVKSSEVEVKLGNVNLKFSLWGVDDLESNLVAPGNALAGRIIGMLAANTKNDGKIVADKLDSKIINGPVSVRLRNGKALLEIEDWRPGGRKLYRELFYRSCVMKAYKELELTEREQREARLLVASADFQYLSQAYFDPQYDKDEHHKIGNAIDYVWYAYRRIGQLHIRSGRNEDAEDAFEKACQYLQFRLDHNDNIPIIRLLDSLAYSTYILALLQSDRVLSAKAVELYNKLSYFSPLGIWQEKCFRNALALNQGSGLSDDEARRLIRSILESASDVPRSGNLAILKARVWKLYGRAMGKLNNDTISIGSLEDHDDLLSELAELHHSEPNNVNIAIMLLKARIANFKIALNEFSSDNHVTSDCALSNYQFAKERAENLESLLQDFNAVDETPDILKTKTHAYELLAKYYFLHCRDFETAQRYNDYLITSNANDPVATMRKHSILGAIATTPQGVIDAAESLEKNADWYLENKNVDEAAWRFFEAGSICSGAIYRLNNEDLRQRAIRLYEKAVSVKRPPHNAAVYRLAENLHLDRKSGEAISHLSKIEETDWRAAILYGRIVCSSIDLNPNIPVAENRLTVTLQHLLRQPQPRSRAVFRKLVNIGCSLSALRGQLPQKAEHEWLNVIREAANDEAIFGACLNALLYQRFFTPDLAEICKKTFPKSQHDKHMREIRDYYLGYVYRKGAVPSLGTSTFTLKPEEVIAIIPDMKRIMDANGRSEVRDLLKRSGQWSPDFDKWLSDIKGDLETNTQLLDIAADVKPELVSIAQLMKLFKNYDTVQKSEQSVWVDEKALCNLYRILSPRNESKLQLNSDGISFSKLESRTAVESDSIIKYSVTRLGGSYLPTNREIRLPF